MPWSLSKQISKLLFQMSAQVYYLSGQTEGRKKAFFGGGASIDLSSKLLDKSVNHCLPTLPVEIGNTLAVFKTSH